MADQKIRVLIVDDQPMVRLGFSAILQNTADMVVVGEAGSAEEAIERFADFCPDVTIMDLRLPGMNGVDAIRALHSRYPDARFLAVTAHEDVEKLQCSLHEGAGSYLLKGMSHETLLDAIRRVNAGEHFLPVSTIIQNHQASKLFAHPGGLVKNRVHLLRANLAQHK
jgi:DNA-binding NarL/FixJ family response regulator